MKGGRKKGRMEGSNRLPFYEVDQDKISLNYYARIIYSILTSLIHNMTNH